MTVHSLYGGAVALATALGTVACGQVDSARSSAAHRETSLAADPRPFTVADSIQMTEIAEPRSSYGDQPTGRFAFSPDQSRFLLTTRSGNLVSGESSYRILMFDVDSVRDFVNRSAADASIAPTVLAEFSTESSQRAIEQVQWLGDEYVSFIGRDAGGVGQVYVVWIRTGEQAQVTSQPSGVVAYGIDMSADVLVYAAPVIPDWSSRNSHGYVVETQDINGLVTLDPRHTSYLDIGYFVGRLSDQAPLQASMPMLSAIRTAGSLPSPAMVSLSPDGRQAVVLGGVAAVPAAWSEYAPNARYLQRLASGCAVSCPFADDAAALNQLVSSEPQGTQAHWMKQLYLVDARTGLASPLLDAPASGAGEATRIVWSPDGRRVFISSTYLPLPPADADSLPKLSAVPSAAVVEIESRAISRVPLEGARPISRMHWSGGDIVVGWDGQSRRTHTARYAYRSGAWEAVDDIAEAPSNLRLSIEEGLNTPPDVLAEDPVTGRRRLITRLNPQLAGLTMGDLQVFEWQDALGRRYTGGLLLPPNFRPGQRYPVVLQTNGFYRNQFLVDGPNGMSTAYAARAMANRDLLVLQMPRLGQVSQRKSPASPWRYEVDGENPRFVSMVESAIEVLSEKGMIDTNRVGLIGFSREGMHVQYAVTFSRYSFAAATIAHSAQATPFSYYLIGNGLNLAGMLSFEGDELLGGPLWGQQGASKWMARSPAFHLDRIRTPLRFEHLGTNVPEYWDTFVTLRRHGRPVEMIHIPMATHQIERPFARYTSQEGNVDWFAFWLKDEESPDPAKADQYQRWRQLRRLQEHQCRVPPPAGGSGPPVAVERGGAAESAC